MLNRLRRKFILVAMGSLSAVLLASAVILNLVYYALTTASSDQLLVSIAENEGEIPEYSSDLTHQMPWDYPITEETPYETRYFLIRTDREQIVTDLKLDFIRAVSVDDAQIFLQTAMARSGSFGYIGRYRYYRCETGDGYLLVFLDCSRQIQTMRSLLIISFGASALILTATGIAVFCFSKRAIQPMVNSVERQKQFITDVSHELRTPLTSILAACELLRMDDPDNEWLGVAQREAQRLGRLVTELVSLSRLDEENPCLEFSRFSLSQTAWDIVTPFQAIALSSGRQLEAEIQDEVSLCGDEAAIQRVLSILLDNAIKYSIAASTIRFRLLRRRKAIFFETVNQCQPIPPESLSRLFDRFYRADPSRSRNTGGSGLGLSMAKAIVEAHGGRIQAQFDPKEEQAIHVQIWLSDSSARERTAHT